LGHPKVQRETSKARGRRIKEGFFEEYCSGKGLDIGFGGDLLKDGCRAWDLEHGDAQYLEGIDDSEFDFVYSSHTLEHMVHPDIALRNWWRVLKNGGYLILYVPHRDLYEKKKDLPSRWNPDHKHFFLLDRDEDPDTRGLIPLIQRSLVDFEIVYAKECDEGHTITDPETPSDGEYSIELVIQKKHRVLNN
jgi:SAM-dependent methyltransferase